MATHDVLTIAPVPEDTATTDDTSATRSTPAPPIGTAVSAVSIKLPPFWPSDPEIWFVQVEAQFSTRGITSQKTKFEYLVSSLSPEIATEVRDLLLRPPADNPYDKLKAELVKRTAASEQRKLQQLISGEELGDRKPTQLLRRMQQLLGDHVAEANQTFLRKLFLRRLPPNVRMVLACSDATTSINTLADMADKVMEVATPSVAAINQPQAPLTSDPEVKRLKEEVSQLAELVATLTQQRRPRRSRSIQRQPPLQPGSRTSSPARFTPQEPDKDSTRVCWYHRKFGEAANKCQEPCNWGNE